MSNKGASSELVSRLGQIWWRIPEDAQTKISLILMANDAIPVDANNIFASLQLLLCGAVNLTHEAQEAITEILSSTQLADMNSKRLELLKYYAMNEASLSVSQKELLCGCLMHMTSFKEATSFPVDRLIASGITNGFDVDAFQFFKDLLDATIEINKVRL